MQIPPKKTLSNQCRFQTVNGYEPQRLEGLPRARAGW